MAKRKPRSSIKYKNIVGSAFPNFVKTQIDKRKDLVGKKTRNLNPNEILWLSNRTGWFRLSSGAKLKPEGTEIPDNIREEILSSVSDLGEIFLESNSFPREASRTNPAGLQAQKAKQELAEAEDALYNTDLARANVLQGGTVSVTRVKNNNNEVKYSTNRKNKFDEIYKQGATDKLGLKPMPGITSVSVGTGGRLQTLLTGEVEFICYDLDQLDIMSKLYMSLGVHVFLEWGHTPYIDNGGKIQKTNSPINYFEYNDNKSLLQAVTDKKEQTGGNYGALHGVVNNFSFNANNDGSYNCKIDIMGPGSMLESLRINNASRIDFNRDNPNNQGTKYASDLENALNSIGEAIRNANVAKKITQGSFGFDTTISTNFGIIDENKFFTKPIRKGKELLSYGETLNSIYENCKYKGPTFKNGKSTTIDYGSNDFLRIGNAWQCVSNYSPKLPSEDPKDELDDLPLSLFFGFDTIYRSGGTISQVVGSSRDETRSQYITFGHLMCLLQHLCIFTFGKDNSKNLPNSALYIDFHPDNTQVLTGPIEASYNPGVCLIPFSVNVNKDVSGDTDLRAFGRFFDPLDTMNNEVYKWDENGKKNISRNIVHNKTLNKINSAISNTTFPQKYDGKIHNVLVNIDFAITTLKRIENQNLDNDVSLIEYINYILDGINLSLGKVNNFRAFFDDSSHVVRIIDEHIVEDITPENLLEIPNYGLNSISYDYSYSTKITPKTAATITIAAQANYKGGTQEFSRDILPYNKFIGGARDRFAELIVPPITVNSINKADGEILKLKASQKLFNDLYNIYALDELTNGTDNYLNLYIDTQNINKNYYSDKNTNLVMPLFYSIEIDGISGILPYSCFKVPDNRLPVQYRGKVAFAVYNINHKFENNNWTTVLNGQTINLNTTIIPDPRPNSTGEITPPPVTRTPQQPLETTKYSGKLDLPLPTADFTIPTSPKAQPEEEDTTVVPEEPLTPTADTPQPITPLIINPEPARIPEDILKARDFIIPLESPGGIPELTAYKDIDYTVAAGFTYRIGFGSDTITSTTGGVRRVKEGDTITSDQAYLDIERRLKTDFKPRVVTTCEANGVNYDSLPSVVKTVLIDCAYNYGSLWNSIVISYRDGGVPGLIAELQRRANKGASQVPRRREAEIRHLGG